MSEFSYTEPVGDTVNQFAGIDASPLHPHFGVEIAGVDLSAPLDEATFAEISLAAERHSLVLFRGQRMDDNRQLGFTRRFGNPVTSHLAYARTGRTEYIFRIGNIGTDGEQLPSTHKNVVFGTGNEMWHSDSSFRPVPAKFSFSFAYEVTPEGGELEFVSTRPAYAELPESLKQRINDAVVIHDYVYSRSKVGENVITSEIERTLPPVRQKFIRRNPVTGEKNFYAGSHAKTLEGWSDSQARAVIDELNGRATRPERIYCHRWREGDFLIWDNRCLLHRGRPYDADRYRRRMHQSRVACEGPTLDEP